MNIQDGAECNVIAFFISCTSFSTLITCVQLNPAVIRDFKIGHGRLGRLDAYTGGLGP